MAFAPGAEAGTFHDPKFLEFRAVLQNHLEIGIESAGGDHDGFGMDIDGLVVLFRGHTAYTAILR